MATVSFSCALGTSQSEWVHGREPQQLRGWLRGRSCEERMAISTNCRTWVACRVGSSGKCRLEFRLRSRRCGFGADFIKVNRLQPKGRRVAAISRLDAEFREEAEIDGNSGVGPETSPFEDQGTEKDFQVDLQLPRRRLLVEFTCNVCQARTQRLVNPEAYKRGTVYVQCGGCEAYHQLVDNLGLVVEYDFRKETDSNSAEPLDH